MWSSCVLVAVVLLNNFKRLMNDGGLPGTGRNLANGILCRFRYSPLEFVNLLMVEKQSYPPIHSHSYNRLIELYRQ